MFGNVGLGFEGNKSSEARVARSGVLLQEELLAGPAKAAVVQRGAQVKDDKAGRWYCTGQFAQWCTDWCTSLTSQR